MPYELKDVVAIAGMSAAFGGAVVGFLNYLRGKPKVKVEIGYQRNDRDDGSHYHQATLIVRNTRNIEVVVERVRFWFKGDKISVNPDHSDQRNPDPSAPWTSATLLPPIVLPAHRAVRFYFNDRRLYGKSAAKIVKGAEVVMAHGPVVSVGRVAIAIFKVQMGTFGSRGPFVPESVISETKPEPETVAADPKE